MTAFNTNGKRARVGDDDSELDLPQQKMSCHKHDPDHPAPIMETQTPFGAVLPFRLSPTIKHSRLFSQTRRNAPQPLFTQTITPTDSDDEMSPRCEQSKEAFETKDDGTIGRSDEKDKNIADVEMALGSPQLRYTPRTLDLDSMMLSPKASPFTILPFDSPHPGSPTNLGGGRMPTPIYGHFQSSPDSQPHSSPELMTDQSTFDGEYEQHMRARRLPTPISEDEAMDTFETAEKVLPTKSASQLRQPARFPPPMPTQPCKRNKPVFSMGFRADCDMCKNRVPGHYNHILWT